MPGQRYQLDNHKLIYHPARVAAWLEGREIFPIYVEIGPSNRCNYRCSFCAFDYTDYRGGDLDTPAAVAAIRQMGAAGVKSVMFAGTGEPLLHPDLPLFVREASDSGMDVSITTNGSLLTQERIEQTLPFLRWVRISFNAGTPEDYAMVHNVAASQFHRVLEGIRSCVERRKSAGLPVTIGVQSLILPENIDGLPALASLLKEIGVDYFSLKPFSRHPKSNCPQLDSAAPALPAEWRKKMEALADDSFQLTFRHNAIRSLDAPGKSYRQCLGLPFWTYIDSDGDVYACSSFVGDRRYVYGNIRSHSFEKIWGGKIRRQVMERVQSRDSADCRAACRLEEVNNYLWTLKHPHPHVNFI